MICDAPPPKSVAIVGLGRSQATYAALVGSHGSRHKVADETWVINTAAQIYQHDRVFFIDDMKHMDPASPDCAPQWPTLLEWLKTHDKPVYTSAAHRDICPSAVEYPLHAVVKKLGFNYLNTSVAFALCFALYLGVKRVCMYGCDFTYPDNHAAEAGRGCVEFWLGYGAAKGLDIAVPNDTTLLDAYVSPENKLYGYADIITFKQVGNELVMDRKPRTAKTGVMRPGHDTLKATDAPCSPNASESASPPPPTAPSPATPSP